MVVMKIGAMVVSSIVRAAGVACSILQGRMTVLAETPEIALCSGLSGQEKDQQTDKRDNMSGPVYTHDKGS
ncbi:MAG: hypothetical protein R6V08_04560 [Desulfuromonadales bacterium]